MSSFGEDNEVWQGKEEHLNMESSFPISQLLNDTTQNGGVSPNPFEIGKLDHPVSSGYSQGNKEAASFVLAIHGDGDDSEPFCEPQGGGFKEGGNSLAEQNGELQMSPDPAGCTSLFLSGNDESGSESLDPSSEGWMADCLNEAEIPSTSDDLNALGEVDCYFDISELSNLLQSDMDAEISQPQICTHHWIMDAETLQPQNTPCARSHLTGERKAGAKKAKAVLYPFALVKPCGVQGDVTLTDINRTLSRTFAGIPHVKDSNSSQPMYTSAFTGKPVISRTKIHTEGNGSIIIMRTRG